MFDQFDAVSRRLPVAMAVSRSSTEGICFLNALHTCLIAVSKTSKRGNTTMKISSVSLIILTASLDAAGAFAPAASSNGRGQPLHSSYLENLGDGPAASPDQQQPPQQAFMQPVPAQYAPAAPLGSDSAATSRGDKFQYSPCTPIGDNTRGGQYGRLSGLAPGRE